jgi:DNA helicase-2/ATP-dependent DNA helicase PcrA
MNSQEREYEAKRLVVTLQQIEKQLVASEANSAGQQTALKVTLTDYWENNGGNASDEAQLVEAVDRQRALVSTSQHTSRQLRKMLHSAYFGRIDFVEEETAGVNTQAEQIYIGISTLTNEDNNELLVYDWRAPVSGMFYDFEKGSAWYNCPDGTINGTINLKRQYKIVNSHIEYMFDADLKIDDEFLQELLGKSVDDKMHTIINSIQREQNQIIRNEEHKALFVEGPAGSGKTAVALHRIAFLLYRDRQSITARNVLIFSPNRLFSDYISNVLPELGEENVLQMTFQDYVAQSIGQLSIRFEDRTSHLESILIHKHNAKQVIRIAAIQFKSSIVFESILQNFLHWILTKFVQDYPVLTFRDQIIFSKADWEQYYLQSYSNMPVVRRLAKIKELIQTRLRPLIHAVRAEKEAEIVGAAEEVNEKVIKALARISAKQELNPLINIIEQLTELNPIDQYRRLFEDNHLFAQLAQEKEIPAEWQEIRNQTLAHLEEGVLPYEDIPPFLYFQGVLQGFSARDDIKHLIIDEAQDYTILQYKILAKLFPNCSWTVAGDPVQAIHPFLQTASLQEARETINIEKSFLFRLTRSYRSTDEIQLFCQALLICPVATEALNRTGPIPAVIQIKTTEEFSVMLIDAIHSILAEGWHSIAIISKTAVEASAIFFTLKKHIDLTLIMREDDTFSHGIVVIPAYLAKGLEFDAVLVTNADNTNYSRNEERKILYTICSRALHRLSLFCKGSCSPFITDMDPNLYQLISE